MARTTLSRAASFSSGATESSRSRNTMSAPSPGALPSIFSLEPGTARQVRRGRFRDRSDMRARVDGHLRRIGTDGPTLLPMADPSLTELADGVYAWLLPGGETGVANAGVVVDDDGITVIDTLMVRSQWEPFAAAVAALGPPVRRTVLTHAHIDHVGGTKAFPASAIYGTTVTSDALDQPMPLDGYKQFMPAFDEEFDDLAEVGTRPVTHLVDGAAQLTPRVELLPASGHTAGDLLVL